MPLEIHPDTPLALPAELTDAARKTFRLPVVGVQLVRERSEAFSTDLRRVRSPRDVFDVVRRFIEHADREIFGFLLLDTKNTIRGIHFASVGNLDSALVHPREVFKAAVLASAAGIIVFHNHPSGDPAPSDEDIATTRRLTQAGELLGIEVLDHVVVGECRYVSLKEKGYM